MSEAVSLDLPLPPSTNRLYRAVGKRVIKSAEYRQWITEAGWRLKAQHPGSVKGPVELSVTVGKSRGDLSNRVKSLEDLLVLHDVIEGDGPAIVRKIVLALDESIDGCRVAVKPMPLGAFQPIGHAASSVVQRLSRIAAGDVADDGAA